MPSSSTTSASVKPLTLAPSFIKGYVYKLYHPECPRVFYVGSSCEPEDKRRSCHISHARTCDSLLYITMRESGERERWVLEKLEDIECKTVVELHEREEHYRSTLGANLNSKRCHVAVTPDFRESKRLWQAEAYRLALETHQYHCDTCGTDSTTSARFKSHNNSKRHLKRVAGVMSAGIKIKESGVHTCNVCEMSFTSKSSLNRHLGTAKHTKNLACYDNRLNEQIVEEDEDEE